MSNEDAFELMEPFEIDHGELDGLTLQQAFVLGVEWQMFHAQLQGGKSFSRIVHTDNLGRFKKMCQRHKRACTEQIMNDDWRILHVQEKGG